MTSRSFAKPEVAASLRAVIFVHLLCLAAPAAAGDADLQACANLKGKASADQELDCYRQAAQAQSKQTEHAFVAMQGRTLAEEWTPAVGVPLKIHRQTYFLVSYTANPNDAPTSPNPQNQVPYSYALDHKEVKYQISIKNDLLNFGRHTIWGAYTQQSFWQVFDTRHSNPFRESNYEPELIYSYRPDGWGAASTLLTSFVNGGFVHQSNGQSLPRSRSWNRLYVQAGLEHEFGNQDRLALIPRYWKRVFAGNPAEDDNPDILDYLGHGDLELRYYHGRGMLSAIARSRSLQLDLAVPLRVLGIENSNLHLQYFHGYGESLIDYNQAHTTYAIGISLPFEDSY